MRGLCAALLLGCLLAPAQAQPRDTLLTLDGLVADALARSSPLRAARLGADALAQRARQAGAFPDPTVSLTAFPSPMQMAHGAQVAQFEAMQMLPAPGVRSRERAAATLTADAERLRAEVYTHDVRLGVTEAYLTLLRLDEIEALLDTFATRLETFADVATARYAVGQTPQSAILLIQIERDKLRAERLAFVHERTEAMQTLARQTERPLTADVRLAPVPPPDTAFLYTALPEGAERSILETDLARADVETSLARRAYFPEVGVGMMYGFVAHDPDAEEHPENVLGLTASVRVPLQRGPLRARVAEAQFREEEVRARLDAFDVAQAAEIASLRDAARAEADVLVLYEHRLLPQSDLSIASVTSAYATGQVPFTALLDAERMQYELRRAVVETRYRYALTLARLARALHR